MIAIRFFCTLNANTHDHVSPFVCLFICLFIVFTLCAANVYSINFHAKSLDLMQPTNAHNFIARSIRITMLKYKMHARNRQWQMQEGELRTKKRIKSAAENADACATIQHTARARPSQNTSNNIAIFPLFLSSFAHCSFFFFFFYFNTISSTFVRLIYASNACSRCTNSLLLFLFGTKI